MSDSTDLHISCPVNVKRRIYVDGVFDLIHWGHLNALRQSHMLGCELVVGIVSDVEATIAKGVPPIYDQDERAELARGCKWVDEVIVGVPYDVSLDFLHNVVKCDFVAHGNDVAIGASGRDCYEEPKSAGKLIYFKRSLGISTSTTLGRLIEALESDLFSHLTDKNESRVKPSEFETTLIENEELMLMEGLSNGELSIPLSGDERTPKGKSLRYPRCRLSTSLLGDFISHRNKPEGAKVIYVDGSFDVFHIGHLRLLQRAKALGDWLVVGLYDDQTVRTLKGSPFPFANLMDRALVVLAMKYTDDVILGAPYVPTKWYLKNLGVSQVVCGISHDSKSINRDFSPHREAKELNIFLQIDSGTSITTTDIVARVSGRMDQIRSNIRKRCKIESLISTGIHSC